jgi:hypothetical protein
MAADILSRRGKIEDPHGSEKIRITDDRPYNEYYFVRGLLRHVW